MLMNELMKCIAVRANNITVCSVTCSTKTTFSAYTQLHSFSITHTSTTLSTILHLISSTQGTCTVEEQQKSVTLTVCSVLCVQSNLQYVSNVCTLNILFGTVRYSLRSYRESTCTLHVLYVLYCCTLHYHRMVKTEVGGKFVSTARQHHQ